MDPRLQIISEHQVPLAPLPTDMPSRMDRLDGIKAVLFDVYGTLFVSGSGDVGTAAATDTAEAFAAALGASGFSGSLGEAGILGKALLREAILASHAEARGAGVDFPEVEIREVWRRVLAALQASGVLAQGPVPDGLVERFALEYECRVNPVAPMPGALEVLAALKRRGLVLGIVSNAQFYTPLLFQAFFGQSIGDLGFDPECCVWSFKERKAKPSRDLFPKAANGLVANHGVSLEQTAYVGNDMLNDIHTAKRAGCKTVLFAGDRRSLRLRENDARCSQLRPDAVITGLAQLELLV